MMTDPTRLRSVALAASTAVLLVASVGAQDRPEPKGQAPSDINEKFQSPDLDAKSYIDRFESESREVSAQRDAIAAMLELTPGLDVADIGAGTGLFSLLFAEQVKPDGKVYAVDIAPAFLNLIENRANERGLGEVVETVKGAQDGTNLEPRSVDVVFLCDTYHHFENPDRMLASIRMALRPGGRLVIVEFDREKAKGDFVAKHVRATKDVFIEEIKAEGFDPIALKSPPELSENFLAVFRKAPTAPARKARAKPSVSTEPESARP